MAGDGREIWAEWCSSFADEFASRARRDGVQLDYSRGSLGAAEEQLYEELEDVRVITLRADYYELIKVATAYLSEVIVRNIGGRPDFDNRIMQATVEDVGVRGLKALPEARVGWLAIGGGGKRKLEQYYDRLRATSEALRSTPVQLDSEKLWGRIVSYVQTCRDVCKSSIRERGGLEMTLTPFVWCSSCDDMPLVAARIVGPESIVKMRFGQVVYELLYEASGKNCAKCGGSSFPLGYSLNFTKVVSREARTTRTVGRMMPSQSRGEEYYLTVVNTTIGRALTLYNTVERRGGEVVGIGEDNAESLRDVHGPFLVRLPDTPFYV
jgi:hypothetical protein